MCQCRHFPCAWEHRLPCCPRMKVGGLHTCRQRVSPGITTDNPARHAHASVIVLSSAESSLRLSPLPRTAVQDTRCRRRSAGRCLRGDRVQFKDGSAAAYAAILAGKAVRLWLVCKFVTQLACSTPASTLAYAFYGLATVRFDVQSRRCIQGTGGLGRSGHTSDASC